VLIKRVSSRYAAVLLGASLVAASAVAGSAPAAAMSSHCGTGGAQLLQATGRAGVAGVACGARARGGLPVGAPPILRHWSPPGWGAQHGPLAVAAGVAAGVPVPGASSQLEGVFCPSASNCWAVGDYSSSGGAELNQALHWNGTKWSQVTTPNPGGTASGDISELFGVRCNSSSDCWAVGDYTTSTAELNQALHWNGTKWSQVTTPNPGGTASGDFSVVYDAWCTSASSCWAAGVYGSMGGGTQVFLNQALHWNGTKWSQVTTPNPEGTTANDANLLDGVRCTSPSNCWAVGSYGFVGSPPTLLNEALHWNGSTWSLISTPDPGGTGADDLNSLNGVACISTSCWGIGAYGSLGATGTTLLNEALHWDGAQWTLVSTPDPDGTGTGANNQLLAANCTTVSNCWAAGSYGSFSGDVGTILNEALHWNGSTWALVSTPDPGGTANLDSNTLRAIRCLTASDCWAVGDAQKNGGADLNQALYWNGTKWSTK
jgi:hypothetical protein